MVENLAKIDKKILSVFDIIYSTSSKIKDTDVVGFHVGCHSLWELYLEIYPLDEKAVIAGYCNMNRLYNVLIHGENTKLFQLIQARSFYGH